MTSKYAIAKELLADLGARAADAGIDQGDVLEATIITLVQAFRDAKGADYVRPMLQYEVDSLGSGGTFDIARGGGHS